MSNKVDNIATEIHNNQKSKLQRVKDNSFDVIACCLVVVMAMLGLGALQLRDITLMDGLNMIIETIPFYMTASMLSLNYYKKGVYAGKSTEMYQSVVNSYLSMVNKLTGRQLDWLNEFCVQFNNKVLRRCQESILMRQSISYARFNDGDESNPPLKCVNYDDLVTKYGKEFAYVVQEAKSVTIKGLNANILLSTFDNPDVTDLGPSEVELFKSRSFAYMITNGVSVIFMTLIGIRDILSWGWFGAILVLFKVGYILCRSYMKYFDGYEDITNKVVNHIARKTDVFKEFFYWYDEKFDESDTKVLTNANDIS
jgi:hypothetical protein